MEIVFRKQVARSPFRLDTEAHVLNRYKLSVKRQFTQAEIASIAAQLFEDDYGHPFTDDEGVYWTLE